MDGAPASVTRLIDAFRRLPTVGPKTAERLTYFLLRNPNNLTTELANALVDLRDKTILCSVCFNLADVDPCHICRNPARDRSVICVVEEPLDILAIERTGEYKGLYHVLHGAISPMERVSAEDLKIRELIERLRSDEVQEIILATNPNMEGDATAMFITRQLASLDVRVTRLARGLPIGGDLEYADQITLTRALEGRREISA
ncbi:MAG TPA: recombination mediator RecR [Chloroflexota bacterium]|nr:recombination mediator RecR [Chloroflexota bacterium]